MKYEAMTFGKLLHWLLSKYCTITVTTVTDSNHKERRFAYIMLRPPHPNSGSLRRPPVMAQWAPHKRTSPILNSCASKNTPQEACPYTSCWQSRQLCGAYWCVFRMTISRDHLKGFVDHVRVFITEFRLCRRRFPAQHQHSKQKTVMSKPARTFRRITLTIDRSSKG